MANVNASNRLFAQSVPRQCYTPISNDKGLKSALHKERKPLASRFIEAVFPRKRHALKAADKAIGDVLLAVAIGNPPGAKGAAVSVAKALAPLARGADGRSSQVQLCGNCLLERTRSMDLPQLNALGTMLETYLTHSLASTKDPVIEHLAFSIKSEILHCQLQAFAKQGVVFGGDENPDISKLTDEQKNQIPEMLKDVADLTDKASRYSNFKTGSIAGANFHVVTLGRIAVQLTSTGAANDRAQVISPGAAWQAKAEALKRFQQGLT